MADKNDRLPQNVAGPWYVDSNCIDCDLCRDTAPSVFRRDDDSGSSIVFHQPATDEERALAEDARASCPVEAIGNDGPPPAPEVPTSTDELKPSSTEPARHD